MKYGTDITKEICDYIKRGSGRVNACDKAGIAYVTFCEWIKKPKFSKAIKKAEKEIGCKMKDLAILTIRKAMQEDKWQAAAWWLERKYKAEYAQKVLNDSKVEYRPIKLEIDHNHNYINEAVKEIENHDGI